jgi:broad specificity phosphatase PhoE
MRSRLVVRAPLFLFVVCFVAFGLLPKACAAADTAFFVVRHAEKSPGSGDVPLSAGGIKRANQLSQLLEQFNVDVIFHTDLARSRGTALPLASKKNITPLIYGEPTQAWIDGLVSAQLGRRVLIVAHSNTVAEIVGRLIGRELPEIGERFDLMFIVVISGDDKSMVCLPYGDPS